MFPSFLHIINKCLYLFIQILDLVFLPLRDKLNIYSLVYFSLILLEFQRIFLINYKDKYQIS